jgi:hypothetical protein
MSSAAQAALADDPGSNSTSRLFAAGLQYNTDLSPSSPDTLLPTALRWLIYPMVVVIGLVAMAVAMAVLVISLAYPNLPSLEILTDYRPKIPLRVYTADGFLLGEFGEERRAVVSIDDVPTIMKQAILAAEDERFYQHGGVDTLGVLRALHANLLSGGKRQGASTITQQVAKNFFLSSEKTYTRKFYEALLSFKIETISARIRFSSCTSTRSFSANGLMVSPPRPISISANPWPSSPSPKRPCLPACRKRRRPTTRWSIRSARAPPGVRPAANERTRIHQRCAAGSRPRAGIDHSPRRQRDADPRRVRHRDGAPDCRRALSR